MLGKSQFPSSPTISESETKHHRNRHSARRPKPDVSGNARNCSEFQVFHPAWPNRRVKPCTTSAISAAALKPASVGSPPRSPSFAYADSPKSSATSGRLPPLLSLGPHRRSLTLKPFAPRPPNKQLDALGVGFASSAFKFRPCATCALCGEKIPRVLGVSPPPALPKLTPRNRK